MNKSKGLQTSKIVKGTIYGKDKVINNKIANVIPKRQLIIIGLARSHSNKGGNSRLRRWKILEVG